MKPETTTTQNAEILRYMQAGGKVNCLMAWLQFGCGALHSRCADLRKEHEIKDRWITVETSRGNKRVKEYWMEIIIPAGMQGELFDKNNPAFLRSLTGVD